MGASLRAAVVLSLLACGLAALLVLLSSPSVRPVAAPHQRREIPRLIHVTWREKTFSNGTSFPWCGSS